MPDGEWYCCDECVRIRQRLQDELAAGETLMPGNPAYRWHFMRGKDSTKGTARALLTVLEILQVGRACG